MVKLAENKDQWPHVLLALFVEQPTPFLPQMLEKLVALDYPKTHISLWVHNKVCGIRYLLVCVHFNYILDYSHDS